MTESFLSKEVSYVVSSNKEAKRDKAKTRPEKRSNEASEDAKAMGPMPSSSKGNHPRPHQKPSDAVRPISVYEVCISVYYGLGHLSVAKDMEEVEPETSVGR